MINIIKRISLVVVEFALQFLPIFLLFIIHSIANPALSETSNADYCSGVLQIIIVDTSVNLCSVLKKKTNYISLVLYVIILTISTALFVLAQVVSLELFQSNSGNLIYHVIKIMIAFLLIIKVTNSTEETNE